MPDLVSDTNLTGIAPDYMTEPWHYGVFSDQSVNSTISDADLSQIREAYLPITGLKFWTTQPHSPNPLIKLRSKLSYRRPAILFTSQEVKLVIEPQAHEDPFEREIGVPTSALPEAISVNWRNLTGRGLSEKTYQRLLDLASIRMGWNGSGSLAMNPSSLFSFIAFWKKIRDFSVDPELVLTPSGNVQAEWFKNERHYLEIDFRGIDENCLFRLVDDRKTAIEGIFPLKEVFKRSQTWLFAHQGALHPAYKLRRTPYIRLTLRRRICPGIPI